MNRIEGTPVGVDALRLGLEPERVRRFTTELILHPETLTICAREDRPNHEAPLLICLHPPRLTEFQFAQRVRELSELDLHLAFPRGLHPYEVDLGGARTVGYAWCHYTGDNPAFRRSLAMASEHLDRILERLLEELPVDRRNVFLLGAGGSTIMATLHGVSRSDLFAGVVSIGGRILTEVLQDFLPETRRIPFLCISSRRERRQASADARRQVDDLRRMGVPVDLELLTSGGEPWQEEKDLVASWLSEKAGIPLVSVR
jgi:predicted esterase